jgi:hypothetical protein
MQVSSLEGPGGELWAWLNTVDHMAAEQDSAQCIQVHPSRCIPFPDDLRKQHDGFPLPCLIVRKVSIPYACEGLVEFSITLLNIAMMLSWGSHGVIALQ